MREFAHRIVHARRFEYLLVVLIIGISLLQGMTTSEYLEERYLSGWNVYWQAALVLLLLGALVLEVLLKMLALSPRIYRYFRDGWNVFDFLTISFLLIAIAATESAAAYGGIILLVRVLRILKGLSTVRELSMILSTLFRSIPSLGHIVVLLGIIVYVYALVGNWSFGEHDPEHWGDLGVSVSSLFQIVTLDDWITIMHTASEVEPLAWIYFFSFVIISAFVVTNVFIAIVIRNLDDDRQERLRMLEAPASREEILRELRSTQQALLRLEERLQVFPD